MTTFMSNHAGIVAAITAVVVACVAYFNDHTGIVVAVATVAAACVAYFALRQQKAAEMTRLTVGFIRLYNSSPRMDDAIRVMRSLKGRNEKEIAHLCAGSDDKAFRERADLLFMLNEFELLAIGLKRGIYDRELVYKYFERDILDIYTNCLPAIDEFRKKDKHAFSEFKKLAADDMKRY